jgi:outer membrane protein OmpA-like peptidoglycan-associated protein
MALVCLLLASAVAAAELPPIPALKPPPPGSEPAPAPVMTSPLPMRPSDTGRVIELAFRSGATELSDSVRAKLADLAAKAKSEDRRMLIKAFASGAEASSSQVRRTSLMRALAVRTYLIDEGVRSTRIDVRALGAPLDGGREDRVDLILLEK